MKYVKIIDENGYFIEDAFVEEITEFTIETPCLQGLYKPKWNGTNWIEGLTQAEIDNIKSNPSIPSLTLEELAENVNAALLAVMELSLE